MGSTRYLVGGKKSTLKEASFGLRHHLRAAAGGPRPYFFSGAGKKPEYLREITGRWGWSVRMVTVPKKVGSSPSPRRARQMMRCAVEAGPAPGAASPFGASPSRPVAAAAAATANSSWTDFSRGRA